MQQAQITKSTKVSEIKRAWHHIDVQDKTLGRIATEIALLLMGKGKPNFVRNLDCGDFVVVTNAKLIKVTGKKEEKKNYHRTERSYGSFTRSFTLPSEVVVDKIAAEYKEGVLNVTLPKTEEAKVVERQIEVK